MEEKIILKGHIEAKHHVLSKPKFYKDTPMICFIIPRDYVQPLVAFTTEKPYASWELTLKPWPKDTTIRAKNLFFALRDRLAVQSGGVSPTGQSDKDYKYHLYKECIKSCNFGKESIKDLNKKELWIMTTVMKEQCIDMGCDIRDLVPEYNSVGKELKE